MLGLLALLVLALSDLLLVVLVLDGVGGGMSVVVVGVGLGVLVGWPVCCPLVDVCPFVVVPDGVGISNGVGGSIFIVFVCIVLALVSMHSLVGLFVIMLFDSRRCLPLYSIASACCCSHWRCAGPGPGVFVSQFVHCSDVRPSVRGVHRGCWQNHCCSYSCSGVAC